MKKSVLLFSMLLICVLLFSCARTEIIETCLAGKQYGFWHGLIQGFINPISFIVSLFDEKVAIYAVNNTGTWYDLGFLLGSGGWGFAAGKGSKK
jgi:hypothetical protein